MVHAGRLVPNAAPGGRSRGLGAGRAVVAISTDVTTCDGGLYPTLSVLSQGCSRSSSRRTTAATVSVVAGLLYICRCPSNL